LRAGASFENTVVLDDNRLLNTEGLRYSTNAPATRRWTRLAI
jgi:UDP-3-O-acyl-N-acetylglucosamine deacetylase